MSEIPVGRRFRGWRNAYLPSGARYQSAVGVRIRGPLFERFMDHCADVCQATVTRGPVSLGSELYCGGF